MPADPKGDPIEQTLKATRKSQRDRTPVSKTRHADGTLHMEHVHDSGKGGLKGLAKGMYKQLTDGK